MHVHSMYSLGLGLGLGWGKRIINIIFEVLFRLVAWGGVLLDKWVIWCI